jgi:hypothetical protein
MYKIYKPLKEKLVLINFDKYVNLVYEAYDNAPVYDESVVHHWTALRDSNYVLFQRLLSKVKVTFTSEDKQYANNFRNGVEINGKVYPVIYHTDPYDSQETMKRQYEETGELMISIDYSTHPVFTIIDNIVFRTVHDFMVHILGGHRFTAKGEIGAYNRHAKLAPPKALPALFTEIVGQVSYQIVTGDFGVQKIAILEGFDYTEVGKVEGYTIQNKELISPDQDNI